MIMRVLESYLQKRSGVLDFYLFWIFQKISRNLVIFDFSFLRSFQSRAGELNLLFPGFLKTGAAL